MRELKILVAPDSFKGSAPAVEACNAIAAGLHEILEATVQMVPLADGGEGTGDILIASGGERVPTATVDIYNRRREASWIRFGRVALIEASQGSGFIPLADRLADGAQTTSLGTGLLVQAALHDPQIDRVVVALGGTGCTDGGFGFLYGLGARFYDGFGGEVAPWGHLMGRVAVCVLPKLKKPLVGLFDVATSLLGEHGCIRMFGEQKGIRSSYWDALESDLTSFAHIVSHVSGVDCSVPGTGAAGGIGFGVLATGGSLSPGADEVGNWVNLDQCIEWADWVITGEGRIDAQTQYGKVVSMVAHRAAAHKRPAVALVGQREKGPMPLCDEGLTLIYPILPRPMSLEEAMCEASELLKEAGKQVGYLIRNLECMQKL